MSESLTLTATVKSGKVVAPKTPEGYVLDRINEIHPPQYVFKKVKKSKVAVEKKKCVNCKCHKTSK